MLVPANVKNSFLSQLSAAEYATLRSHLAPMELRVGHSLHCLGEPVEEVIFPHSGLVGLSMTLRDDLGAAAALTGHDGVVGLLAGLVDAPAASDAIVHVAGYASRLSAAEFRELVDQNPSLLRRVARYAQALLAQSQQNAVCHAVHPVGARICRWLLAIQACCGGDDVRLTQGALAQMLGVRRTTVTLIAQELEALGVIKCHRGSMHIVRLDELRRHSCECQSMLDGYLSDLLSPPADDRRPSSQ